VDLASAGQVAIGPKVVAVVDLDEACGLVGDRGLHFPAHDAFALGAELLPVVARAGERLLVESRLVSELGSDAGMLFEDLERLGNVEVAVLR